MVRANPPAVGPWTPPGIQTDSFFELRPAVATRGPPEAQKPAHQRSPQRKVTLTRRRQISDDVICSILAVFPRFRPPGAVVGPRGHQRRIRDERLPPGKNPDSGPSCIHPSSLCADLRCAWKQTPSWPNCPACRWPRQHPRRRFAESGRAPGRLEDIENPPGAFFGVAWI